MFSELLKCGVTVAQKILVLLVRVRISTLQQKHGRLAQLVQQRLPYKQKVTGSNPVPPTNNFYNFKDVIQDVDWNRLGEQLPELTGSFNHVQVKQDGRVHTKENKYWLVEFIFIVSLMVCEAVYGRDKLSRKYFLVSSVYVARYLIKFL